MNVSMNSHMTCWKMDPIQWNSLMSHSLSMKHPTWYCSTNEALKERSVHPLCAQGRVYSICRWIISMCCKHKSIMFLFYEQKLQRESIAKKMEGTKQVRQKELDLGTTSCGWSVDGVKDVL